MYESNLELANDKIDALREELKKLKVLCERLRKQVKRLKAKLAELENGDDGANR